MSVTSTVLDIASIREASHRWGQIAHPLHGLGVLEDIIVQIAGIKGSADFSLDRRAVLIFCGDNGISETAVSQSDSSVTAMVASDIAEGRSLINAMARTAGAFVRCIDVGIKDETSSKQIVDRKIKKGTANFLTSPAMTAEEANRCIEAGKDEIAALDADIAAIGEMGIGDTTCAAIITASLLGLSADEVAGRGAGLSDEGFSYKKKVIAESIRHGEEPLELLARIGGTEIGAMAGAYLGAARRRLVAIADGAVSLSAALLAERISPGTRDFVIASVRGRERMSERIVKELRLSPVIDADMSLGEGTGAVLLLPLISQALAVYSRAHSFRSMQLVPYEKYD